MEGWGRPRGLIEGGGRPIGLIEEGMVDQEV